MAELVPPSSMHGSIPVSSVMSLLMDLEGRISTFRTSWATASTTDPSSAQTHSDMMQQNTSEIPPLSSNTNAASPGADQVEDHAADARDDLAKKERAARLAEIMGEEKRSGISDLPDSVPEVSTGIAGVDPLGNEDDEFLEAQEAFVEGSLADDLALQEPQDQTTPQPPALPHPRAAEERSTDVVGADALANQARDLPVAPEAHDPTIPEVQTPNLSFDSALEPDQTAASSFNKFAFDKDTLDSIRTQLQSLIDTVLSSIEDRINEQLGSYAQGRSVPSYSQQPEETVATSRSGGPTARSVHFDGGPGDGLSADGLPVDPQVPGTTGALPVADGKAPAVPIEGTPDVQPDVTTPLPTAGEESIIDKLHQRNTEQEKPLDARILGDGNRYHRG